MATQLGQVEVRMEMKKKVHKTPLLETPRIR